MGGEQRRPPPCRRASAVEPAQPASIQHASDAGAQYVGVPAVSNTPSKGRGGGLDAPALGTRPGRSAPTAAGCSGGWAGAGLPASAAANGRDQRHAVGPLQGRTPEPKPIAAPITPVASRATAGMEGRLGAQRVSAPLRSSPPARSRRGCSRSAEARASTASRPRTGPRRRKTPSGPDAPSRLRCRSRAREVGQHQARRRGGTDEYAQPMNATAWFQEGCRRREG